MQQQNPIRVVTGMSGGIDSTAAALLLKQQGHEVIGVTLKLWEYENETSASKCCTPEDVRDARKVAAAIDIPFYVRDYSEKFAREVVDYFTTSYLQGKTPNPCAVCNDKIKFALLDLLARDVEAPFVGTGHYAQVTQEPQSGEFQLRRGVDESRDQSYFLFRLTQERLSRLLLPLGGLRKSEVRDLLRSAKIGNPDKPESRDICFVENGRYAEFVAKRAASQLRPGVITSELGERLGEHHGIHEFTVGQRKGIGIASTVANEAYYVTKIDPEKQQVTVGHRNAVMKDGCDVDEVSWISTSPATTRDCEVQLRYRGTPVACRLEPAGERRWRVNFLKGKELPAPGQAAVFYDGDRLLGGGWIQS